MLSIHGELWFKVSSDTKVSDRPSENFEFLEKFEIERSKLSKFQPFDLEFFEKFKIFGWTDGHDRRPQKNSQIN